MNNKKIVLIYCVCMMVFLFGCGKEKTEDVISTTSEAEQIETEQIETEQIEEEQVEEEQSYESKVVSNPDGIGFEELPNDIQGLLIPIDSLLLYHVENGLEYVPNDPEMFWMVMHYSIVNFGEAYNRAEFQEYEVAAKSKVINEFASAIISDLEEIPSIPDSLGGNIRYDSEEDLYFFSVGDRGLSQTEILSYEYVDNNTLKIHARLFAMDDDSTIKKGDFVLTRNEYAADVMEPLFHFSVSEVVFVEE